MLGSAVARPHLEGGEHDAELQPSRMDLGAEARAVGSITLRRSPCFGQCSFVGCALVSAKHERMRQLAAPDLQSALHCTHEAVWILSRMLRLQSVEELPAGQ